MCIKKIKAVTKKLREGNTTIFFRSSPCYEEASDEVFRVLSLLRNKQQKVNSLLVFRNRREIHARRRAFVRGRILKKF